MKALVFAAGLGTRLKPITDTIPKALVPIKGIPLLEHVVIKLKHAGFTEIVINIHHFGQQIVDFIHANNSFGITIHISDERDKLLETGGGIKKAAQWFGNEPFLVHNVDILSTINLKECWDYYLKSGASALLVVSSRDTSRYLLFDESVRLKGWINKQTNEVKSPYSDLHIHNLHAYAFSGIHIISPSLLKYMNEWGDTFSIIDYYLSIADKETIKGMVIENLNLMDVGKLNSLKEAEAFCDVNVL